MKTPILSVREITTDDIEPLTNYWQTAGDAFLTGMGCDVCKMPTKEQSHTMLSEQIKTPIEKKQSYCTIWLADVKAIGHSNINQIIFGESAYMHLHLWISDKRKKGMGIELVKKSMALFFEKAKLKKIYCEPYSLNPAPNKLLEKLGFTFVKKHITTPGSINLEQEANLWEMSLENFRVMK